MNPSFRIIAVPAPPRVVVEPVVCLDGSRRPLDDAEVEVWALPASFLAPQRTELAATLSADECARRDRFVREVDQVRFELFHGALRRILAGYLDVAPAALQFEQGPAGKPSLAPRFRGTGLDFNLSHSGDLLVLACARHRALGVDVEQVDRRTEVEPLAARFFHPHEHRALAQLTAAGRRQRFFQWWTAREAWLKAHGLGLTDGLAELDFSSWADESWLGLADESGSRWLAWSFGRAGFWAGTLVAGSAPDVIRWRPAEQRG